MITKLSRVGIYKIHLEEISTFFVDFLNQLHRFFFLQICSNWRYQSEVAFGHLKILDKIKLCCAISSWQLAANSTNKTNFFIFNLEFVVIDYIGGLSNHIKEKETLDIKDRTTRFHFIRVCTIIKDLNEIDPGWCLRYFEPDDECLKIKLHDCKCCYHTCQNSDKVTQSPKSNSNKSSQVKDKESTQEWTQNSLKVHRPRY